MSTISHRGRRARARDPHGHRLWCTKCDTDEHLVIESVQALEPPRTGLVDAAYTCRECAYFYAHPATVADVAGVLNRPGPEPVVLQFGGAYLHCGELMMAASSEHHSIYAPLTTEDQRERPLEVYLRTKVLRCPCGFQMEIPD